MRKKSGGLFSWAPNQGFFCMVSQCLKNIIFCLKHQNEIFFFLCESRNLAKHGYILHLISIDWKWLGLDFRLPPTVPWLTCWCVDFRCIFTSFFLKFPACLAANPISNSGTQQAGQRANPAGASAVAQAQALATARRGSYPLSAVAALTAAQQRNLAAMQAAQQSQQITTTASLTGSGNSTMVSAAAQSAQGQQHASPLTAVAAAAQQQLHGLTP